MKAIYILPVLFLFFACDCEEAPVGLEGLSDLKVHSIEPESFHCDGGLCANIVQIGIANMGQVTAYDFSVETFFGPNETGRHVQFIDSLPDGIVEYFTATSDNNELCFDPDCPIRSVVDSGEEIEESNENNNELISVFAAVDFLPDLTVEDSIFLKGCNDTMGICINALITNMGSIGTGGFGDVIVSVYINDLVNPITMDLNPLFGGENRFIEIPVEDQIIEPCFAIDCDITIIIDEQNKIPEFNEENNSQMTIL